MQYDQLTGQYYLKARYYNPVIGRFTQMDTYLGDGLNLYAYVQNNPVRYVDPSGHCAKCSKENGVSGSEANKVYFGQKAVSPKFSSQRTFKGASIQSVADRLESDELSADNLPFEYIVRDGKMITMNNRSLTALSKANMKPMVLIDIY